jgi:hypothetical protein
MAVAPLFLRRNALRLLRPTGLTFDRFGLNLSVGAKIDCWIVTTTLNPYRHVPIYFEADSLRHAAL